MSRTLDESLTRIAERYDRKATTSALSFAIEQPARGVTWRYGEVERPHAFASVTKLVTAACTLQLCDERSLSLETRAVDVLGAETMRGLNMHGGRDHGAVITVRELLSHTSGIPDYFEERRRGGTTLADEIAQGDRAWAFDECLELARGVPARFAPSTPGRTNYSDTN